MDIINWTYSTYKRSDGSNSTRLYVFLPLLGWTGIIAYKEKEQLVATAILHEVIWKRESAINQLLQGLKFCNVLDTVRKYPQHFLEMFVYTNTVVNSTVLLQHIRFDETSNDSEKRAKEFFVEYIGEDVEIPCGDGKLCVNKIYYLENR